MTAKLIPIEPILDWIENKASQYLVWRYETRVARAAAVEEECESCHMPDSFCDCNGRRRDELEAAFDDGVEHAAEMAARGERW